MLTHREKQEILALLEAQVKALQGMNRIEKMQMIKRIRRTVDSIAASRELTPDMVMTRLEYKLSDIFSALPYGFKRDFVKSISEKMKQWRSA
jgi:hypothetical protein